MASTRRPVPGELAQPGNRHVLDTNLQLACDRLSQIVDATQFERMRWARTEAPMLAHLTELFETAVADRPDFETGEEGSTAALKRFVVKVHGMRVLAVSIALSGTQVTLGVEELPRSRYRVEAGAPLVAEYAAFDAELMAAALQDLFSRVSS